MLSESTRRAPVLAAGLLLAACAGSAGQAASGTSPVAQAPTVPAPPSTASAAGALPLKRAPQPTRPAIDPNDLMTRMYVFADDSMQGREFSTRGNVMGTDYIAAELGRMGLEPAGENGTFFQVLPVSRRRLDPASALKVGGATLAAWTDFAPFDQGPGVRDVNGAPVVYGGVWGDTARLIGAAESRGKVVVLTLSPGPGGVPAWTAPRQQVQARFPGAVGIALATLDRMPSNVRAFLREPGTRVGAPDSVARPAHFWVTPAAAARMLGGDLATLAKGASGGTITGSVAFRTEPAEFPARNVVAVLRGSDPALRGQYVAIGSHNDHIGVAPSPVDHDSLRAFNTVMRPQGADDEPGQPSAEQAARIASLLDSLRRAHPPRLDSIANGADDDGSGSVAMLEIAEELAAAPVKPRRSVLFIWHTGEEAGLLGAAHFTAHPTVPRDSIVTQLNIDMIGRGRAEDTPGGGPGYLQLIGSRRLSKELGDLVESVNASKGHGFTFDYQFDANGHPGQFYCRSDHYEYAKYGIPVTFFSSGGHRDYHMVTDEPQYIDYAKLARVSALIRDVALAVANLDHRPALSAPKPDPEGQCVQ
jgi:hypothetical protein